MPLASTCASFAQPTRVLLGVKWNGQSEVFNSVNILTQKFKDIKFLPYVSGAELGESTLDQANKRYFYNSNSGLTVVDATNGIILDTFGISINLRGIEYDSNKIIGTYWNGKAVMLASLNLDTKKLNDIGILKGVTGSEQGETTFDAINGRYFIKTNLGITIVNAANATTIDTINISKGMNGIEYDPSSNSLIGNYWNGKYVILMVLNIATKKFKDIGILKGVNEITLGESTFDKINKTYFIKTNFGITVINSQSAAIIDTIADNIILKSMEFFSYSDQLEVKIIGKCISDSALFKLSYSDNIDSAKWNFGDTISGKNNFSNKTTDVYHIYKNYGIYSIKFITFYKNLSDTFISMISFEQPKADFTVSDICEGFKGVFTNTSLKLSEEPNYKWNFGDGQTSTAKSPEHLYDIESISQTFNVTLIVKTQTGCADSTNIPITINAKPKSDFSFSLYNNLWSFIPKQSGNIKYRWSFGDGDSAIAAMASHSYKDGLNSHTVCLKVTNTAGCYTETCKQPASTGLSNTKSSGFKIYPNPNTGNFNIEIDNPEKDMSIEVYNSVGEMVERIEMVGNVADINLDIASGIYLVKVRNGKMECNQKVSIVK